MSPKEAPGPARRRNRIGRQASALVDVRPMISLPIATVNGFWPGAGIDESDATQIPCKWAQKSSPVDGFLGEFWESRRSSAQRSDQKVPICRDFPRRRPESNRCRRLCRPLRSHSATSPRGTPSVSGAARIRRPPGAPTVGARRPCVFSGPSVGRYELRVLLLCQGEAAVRGVAVDGDERRVGSGRR
jgi:hypothetical protein